MSKESNVLLSNFQNIFSTIPHKKENMFYKCKFKTNNIIADRRREQRRI